MKKPRSKSNLIIIMIVYLAGIFMGALDTGIVTPARTVIQNNFLVDDQTGIWMITIYSLAYAASIPIMGKLADLKGRKKIYLVSILIFGLGSLFCGLAQYFNSFGVLLLARVIQALGGGGIVPVATAEFGTTFPPEKRGMALGLVGGVYGIANIFGSSAGSAILDLFGKSNWQFIFYVNLPITIFILIAGFIFIPDTKSTNIKKMDIGGIFILTIMILSLMYGLKNIDFYNFQTTLTGLDVYPFLLLFIVLLPIFILAEKKADDPVLNLSYFTDLRIVITFLIAFITGMILMGVIFVPQFAENALKIASGSGGYFVIILGLFAGVGAPVSGKLIDKYGPKLILALGFLISIIGSLFLILVTIDNPNMPNVIISLILMGLGLGFTMGTPLNYMMMENTKQEESSSALAALSLVRSIGTVLAPAIMAAFLAHAGGAVQSNILDTMPKEVTLQPIPYSRELVEDINGYRTDPILKNILATVYIPDLTALEKINIDMGDSNSSLPEDLKIKMKVSDVTTITDNCKLLADRMFTEMSSKMTAQIQNGINNGINEINSGISIMNGRITDTQRIQMQNTIDKMTKLSESLPGLFKTAKADYIADIDKKQEIIESRFQKTINIGFRKVYLTVTISSLAALLILIFYRRKEI